MQEVSRERHLRPPKEVAGDEAVTAACGACRQRSQAYKPCSKGGMLSGGRQIMCIAAQRGWPMQFSTKGGLLAVHSNSSLCRLPIEVVGSPCNPASCKAQTHI